jgi:hypothetical protein
MSKLFVAKGNTGYCVLVAGRSFGLEVPERMKMGLTACPETSVQNFYTVET